MGGPTCPHSSQRANPTLFTKNSTRPHITTVFFLPQGQAATHSNPRANIMKLSTTLPLLSLSLYSFLPPLAHAAPKTRYSTITIIPVPLSTTITHYHPTSSFYPSGSDKSGFHKAHYNASAKISLSYTLSYPTTNLPPIPMTYPQRSAEPSISSNATMTGMLGNSSPPLRCTPGELYCDSNNSFSLCAPGVGGGSRYAFMGGVANGTSCDGGRIRKADGGRCTPVGSLKCRGETRFFLCDEGMFFF